MRREPSAGVAAVEDREADGERARNLVDYMSRTEQRLGALRGAH